MDDGFRRRRPSRRTPARSARRPAISQLRQALSLVSASLTTPGEGADRPLIDSFASYLLAGGRSTFGPMVEPLRRATPTFRHRCFERLAPSRRRHPREMRAAPFKSVITEAERADAVRHVPARRRHPAPVHHSHQKGGSLAFPSEQAAFLHERSKQLHSHFPGA
jgi:hypothetical protein